MGQFPFNPDGVKTQERIGEKIIFKMKVLLLLSITAAFVATGAEGLKCHMLTDSSGPGGDCTAGKDRCTTTYKNGVVYARGCGSDSDKNDCDNKADCLAADECVCTCDDADNCNSKDKDHKKAPVGAVKANAKPNAAIKPGMMTASATILFAAVAKYILS